MPRWGWILAAVLIGFALGAAAGFAGVLLL